MRKVCALTARPEALEGQTRGPDDVAHPTRFAASEADWLWLVDADPEPRALEALLEPLDALGPLPAPVLLAGKLVRPDGTPTRLPVPRLADADLSVHAFERHLVPIRTARRGSLLVHRRAVAEFGLPGAGELAWSARVLRKGFGLLVPASVAVHHGPGGEDGARELLALLLSDGLDPKERALVSFRLAEATVRRLRGAAA